MSNRLVLPRNVIEEMCEHVSTYGRLGVETGALLMCDLQSGVVTTLALAGEAGVTRRSGLFILSMPVINQAFTFAEDRDLQVRAQVHSHARGAFLSPTDRRGNLTMNGFIAAVIPHFEQPPQNPSSWGWWTFSAGNWRTSDPAIVGTVPIGKVLTVDADGVSEY
jgi:proteasome lid subunit RPN8/RPN11